MGLLRGLFDSDATHKRVQYTNKLQGTMVVDEPALRTFAECEALCMNKTQCLYKNESHNLYTFIIATPEPDRPQRRIEPPTIASHLETTTLSFPPIPSTNPGTIVTDAAPRPPTAERSSDRNVSLIFGLSRIEKLVVNPKDARKLWGNVTRLELDTDNSTQNEEPQFLIPLTNSVSEENLPIFDYDALTITSRPITFLPAIRNSAILDNAQEIETYSTRSIFLSPATTTRRPTLIPI